VPRRRHVKLRALVDELARVHPELMDPTQRIVAGDVLVDGATRRNPASLVRVGVSIALRSDVRLRGEAKLEAALSVFSVDIGGRIALDVGAAAGGFTRVLLAAGARRVYAVDAGHGQLLGSLRQDARVVVLEATNLQDLDRALVPDAVEVVTIDLSYLSLREAVPQLEQITIAPTAHAIALVKPQFELGRERVGKGGVVRDSLDRREALVQVGEAVRGLGYSVLGFASSGLPGPAGNRESFVWVGPGGDPRAVGDVLAAAAEVEG
jgi:23S rRNA (cytidine1920-2'-O)/16S rRNA (cytidine1409-2'-O)-methyltransferase